MCVARTPYMNVFTYSAWGPLSIPSSIAYVPVQMRCCGCLSCVFLFEF